MPRKNLIRQNQFPYHITTRTNNKEWFNISMQSVWRIFKESILYANKCSEATIHQFVLMSNHYHLLITSPEIDKYMFHLNKRFSDKLKEYSLMINHKFANRYSWSIVNKERYLHNVYRYIYQNPIRAKICHSCFDYSYSSLNVNKSELELNEFLNPSDSFVKEWLDQIQKEDINEVIRLGLKKYEFSVSRKRYKDIDNSFASFPQKGPRT